MTDVSQRGAWKDEWYVVPYDVLFSDLDYFGHVNNALYIRYFETARTDLWFTITGTRRPLDIGFIVARAECDFKKQINLERIEIAVRFGELGNTSIAFLYEIRKNDGRDIAATGKVVVVLYDWARQSKVAISDELRRTIAACSPDVY
ncbi:MAG TPA: thioesterase family protein [Thermoanaerobaculia bacterium]|jgi:acyl-CoA thioester hydrolase